MGLQHAGTGEVACRRGQSCEASSGEVDGMGLLLGQAVPLVPLKTGSVHAGVYRDLLRRQLLPCFVFLLLTSQFLFTWCPVSKFLVDGARREGLPPVNSAELRHGLTNHEDFLYSTSIKKK